MHPTPRTRRQAARRARRRTDGFTLVEVMIALTISTIVMAAMLTAFVWVIKRTSECQQFGWAQTESVKVSQRLVAYLRNASVITNIDVGGDWIEVVMPTNNTISRISYVNTSGLPGAGRLVMVPNVASSSSPTNVLAYGLTKVMTLPTRNVFERSGPNALRIAFRITQPSESGQYPSEVDIGVRLRNHP